MFNPDPQRTDGSLARPIHGMEEVNDSGLTPDEEQLLKSLAQRLLDGSSGRWLLRREKALAVMTLLADGDTDEGGAMVAEIERLVADWNEREWHATTTIPVPF